MLANEAFETDVHGPRVFIYNRGWLLPRPNSLMMMSAAFSPTTIAVLQVLAPTAQIHVSKRRRRTKCLGRQTIIRRHTQIRQLQGLGTIHIQVLINHTHLIFRRHLASAQRMPGRGQRLTDLLLQCLLILFGVFDTAISRCNWTIGKLQIVE